jgi:hypothetical protein
MNHRDLILEIQRRQLTTFCSISEFRRRAHIALLPTKHRGMYWLWSNLSPTHLGNIVTRPNTKEVPISSLFNQRKKLSNICKISLNNFTIVYNGIGGYQSEPAKFGLRERINQELNCNDHRTGTLNLLNRLTPNNTINNWAVSYFDFDDIRNRTLLNNLNSERNHYLDNAKTIEMNWRIEFGTPIFTRH